MSNGITESIVEDDEVAFKKATASFGSGLL
jgi:hypothetical protein